MVTAKPSFAVGVEHPAEEWGYDADDGYELVSWLALGEESEEE